MSRINRRPTPLGVFEAKLGDSTISYTLRRSYVSRYVRLEIRAEGGLIVTVPRNYRLEHLPALLEKKKRWLFAVLEKFRERHGAVQGRQPVNGDIIPFLGKPLSLHIVENLSAHTTIKRSDGSLTVMRSTGCRDVLPALEAWYRAKAQTVVESKVATFAREMGVNYGKIRIGGAKTRWGSCSPRGNLNFCWRIVMAPQPVIDYVIIHELAHVKEMNHSRRFWDMLAKYCPDWRAHRKWLKNHGAELARWEIPVNDLGLRGHTGLDQVPVQ